MAVNKATTVKDLSTEDLTASAVDPQPTRPELVERVVEHSDSDLVAKTADVKYVKVTSPAGTVTEVPESLVDALKDSGYSTSSKTK